MARDLYHHIVKIGLVKEGWNITHDPLHIDLEETYVEIDLAADIAFAANKGEEKIAVEVKSFLGKSIISEFHTASKYEQAAFMVIVFGESSYEEQKAKFAKKEPKEGETVISKKVEMLNGRETLIYKCKQTEDDLTFIFHIFTCKGDDNTVIMSSGSCKPEDESALEKTFEAAASSVKLKK